MGFKGLNGKPWYDIGGNKFSFAGWRRPLLLPGLRDSAGHLVQQQHVSACALRLVTVHVGLFSRPLAAPANVAISVPVSFSRFAPVHVPAKWSR